MAESDWAMEFRLRQELRAERDKLIEQKEAMVEQGSYTQAEWQKVQSRIDHYNNLIDDSLERSEQVSGADPGSIPPAPPTGKPRKPYTPGEEEKIDPRDLTFMGKVVYYVLRLFGREM